MTDDAYATVIVLDSGHRVRASEHLDYVEEWMQHPRPSGLLEVTDPGDDRLKRIPVSRIAYFEAEEAGQS